MCQLLGMNSHAAASIRFSFTGFAQRGGCTADHVDGWGIAFDEPSGTRAFLHDRPASQSPRADFVPSTSKRSHNVISQSRARRGGAGLGTFHTTAICKTFTLCSKAAPCPRPAPKVKNILQPDAAPAHRIWHRAARQRLTSACACSGRLP